MTANASPEKVTEGKAITVKGTVRRDGKMVRAITALESAGDHIIVKAMPKPAAHHPKPKTYKSYTALRKVYKHGVGKSGAHDKGGNVTNFTRDSKTYAKNKKSDRAKDGIACEG